MKVGDELAIDALIKDEALSGMAAEEFDAMPFGAIRLDAADTVVVYNASEAALARLDPAETIGKNFFTDVAPCTSNDLFRGRLEKMLVEGRTSERFDYTFRFAWGDKDVRIQFWVPRPDQRWIFVEMHDDD